MKGPQVDPRLKQLLKDVALVARTLGGTWGVTLSMPETARQPYKTLRPRKGPAPKQPTNAEVLGYLLRMKGDFLKNTATLRDHLQAELAARFITRGTFPNAQAIKMAAAVLYRDWMVERLYEQGKDVKVKQNSAKWTAYKRKLGYSTKVLMASGQLAKAVNKSIPRLVRIGG